MAVFFLFQFAWRKSDASFNQISYIVDLLKIITYKSHEEKISKTGLFAWALSTLDCGWIIKNLLAACASIALEMMLYFKLRSLQREKHAWNCCTTLFVYLFSTLFNSTFKHWYWLQVGHFVVCKKNGEKRNFILFCTLNARIPIFAGEMIE